MMRKIYLLVSVLLLTLSVVAQNGSISGKLIDGETGEPISFANIAVMKQTDSTLVTGKASGNDGSFTIPVAAGTYIVHASFIGYHDLFRNVTVTSQAMRVQLDTLLMVSDNILLDDAVVTAKAPEIIIRGDTTEFNADSYKVAEGAVLEEMLRALPGAEVNSDGQITINGRVINRIQMNGEDFFGTNTTTATQNVPANIVQRIQVMPRRTDRARLTGFDDGDEETVINLITRPGMNNALMGELRGAYGSQDLGGARTFINYMRDRNRYTVMGGWNNTNGIGFQGGMQGGGRGGDRGGSGGRSGLITTGNVNASFNQRFSDKFRVTGSAGYNNTETNAITNTSRQDFLSPERGGNTLQERNSYSSNISESYNMNFELRWVDTMTEINFRPTASIGNTISNSRSDGITIREATGDTINISESRSSSVGSSSSIGGELNISRKIGIPERVLNIELFGNINRSESERNNLSNTYYFGKRPDDIRDLLVNNTGDNRSWRTRISYVEPIGTNNFLQLSYNINQGRRQSDAVTHRIDDEGNYSLLDTALTRRNDNNFTDQTLELNFRSVRGIYSYRVGFTARPNTQHNRVYKVDSLVSDIRQNIMNYAPIAQFNIRWSRSHRLELRYYGNTTQPTIDQLSPVIDISDPLNIRYGNPNLKPTFSHSITSRYDRANPERGSSLNIAANARYLTNSIVSFNYQDTETGVRESTFTNVTGNWNADGNVTFNIPLRNIKYSFFSSSRVNYRFESGYINRQENESRRTDLTQSLGLNYRSDIFDFSIRGNISSNEVRNSLEGQRNTHFYDYGGRANTLIRLPWNLEISSDITYSASAGYTDGFNLSEWIWNASTQKALFKQRNGIIGINFYDILQQRKNLSRIVSANSITDTRSNTLTSFFLVSFIYRFNLFGGLGPQPNMIQRDSPPREFGGGQEGGRPPMRFSGGGG